MRALHERHAPAAVAYFLRSGFEPAAAQDLCQETFMRVFGSLRTFDATRAGFGTWLGAIARNVARRAWAKRTPSAATDFDLELAADVFADPADEMGRQEELAALGGCIDALPAELAELVRLRYVQARTTRGIAAATGVPESTVRMKLEQALLALQRCLGAKGFRVEQAGQQAPAQHSPKVIQQSGNL